MTKLEFALEYNTSRRSLSRAAPPLPALDDCRKVEHVTLETCEADACDGIDKVRS